jgi:hypothetical protein
VRVGGVVVDVSYDTLELRSRLTLPSIQSTKCINQA